MMGDPLGGISPSPPLSGLMRALLASAILIKQPPPTCPALLAMTVRGEAFSALRVRVKLLT